MKKIAVVISLAFVFFAGCATFQDQIENWSLKGVATLKEGVVVKEFGSPTPPYQTGIIFYLDVGREPVYKQWQEKGKNLAVAKTKDGWERGEPLAGYALFDKNKLVFFLLIQGEVKKFSFDTP